MHREALLIAIMLSANIAHGANFTGDPEFVAAAEKARIASSEFWTGKKLREWKEPCPITLEEGKSSGKSKFFYDKGTAERFRMFVKGPREEVIREIIPHEVDHMVRATIVGHPIPRWLDEGSASLFESPSSRERIRSSLLYGDLKNSAWDMIHLMEYPQDSDAMTALYSESASIVEWMVEMRGPKEVLKAQVHSLSTPQQWQLYVGEPISRSRQRYDEWFQNKYRDNAEPSDPYELAVNDEPFTAAREELPTASVFVAGDFRCDPCHRFLEYIEHSEAGRRFKWEIHRVSRSECQKQGISVPMFVVNGEMMSKSVERWSQVDDWAAEKLGLNSAFEAAPDLPVPAWEQPSIPPAFKDEPIASAPVEVVPGVTMTPDAMRAVSEMLLEEKSPPKSDVVFDWSSFQVVIALSDDNEKINRAVKGPSMRAFRRLSEGKANINLICEADNPAKFKAYKDALELDIAMFHVSVLVSDRGVIDEPALLQKIEVLLHATAKNFSGEKVIDIPVEIISEELDGETYEDILMVLDKPDELVTDENEIMKYIIGGLSLPLMWYTSNSAMAWWRKRKPAVLVADAPEDKE